LHIGKIKLITNSEGCFLMKIEEMIVVEGRDDTTAIKRAVEADTIETGGSALNKEKIERIRLAQERRGVIIFTDPDYPGERIRKLIDAAVPGCKHAFLPREKAVSKRGKFGVEHASPENIRWALAQLHKDEESARVNDQGKEDRPTKVTQATFIDLEDLSLLELQTMGLIGGPSSQMLREIISTKLRIGYCNGKQFIKRLTSFRISREEFEQAYAEAMKEATKND
jgi:ribonuclease M5